MDTSNSDSIVEQLRGTNKVSLDDISAEAWLEVIDDLYRQPLVVQVPHLFVRIVDIMDNPFISKFKLARGQTAFDREIGINTLVCSFELTYEEKGQTRLLLLLPPELKKPLKWAVWCIGPAPQPSINKLQSYIYWAREEVYEIFSQHPHVGCNVIDRLHLMARQYAESLRKTAGTAEVISLRASQMYWRIKR